MFYIPKKHIPLFSFQKLNKYFFLPFFVPIICFTTKFFSETMKTDGSRININDVSEDNVHTFVFLYQIIQSICLILVGLMYFVNVKVSKTRSDSLISELSFESKTDTFSSKGTRFQRSGSKKSTIKQNSHIKKNVLVCLMPILLILYNLGIAYGVKHPQLEKRVYFLFFITLINIFIFKKEIYKHQKLSLIITAIGIIPVFVAFGVYLNVDEYSLFYDIFLFFGSFCYSLYLVFIKYLTLNKQMNVFLLLLYQGFLCTVYTILIYIIISLIIKGDLTYIYNIFHCSETNYICVSYYYFKIIMYFILNTVLQALIFLVVYHFSPELFAISDIFSPLFSFIALCIETNETNGTKIFLTVIGYLIIAVASFIYNELIVCNFCGLNENTWNAIDKKAHDEIVGKDSRDSLIINENYTLECGETKDDENCYEMNQY